MRVNLKQILLIEGERILNKSFKFFTVTKFSNVSNPLEGIGIYVSKQSRNWYLWIYKFSSTGVIQKM